MDELNFEHRLTDVEKEVESLDEKVTGLAAQVEAVNELAKSVAIMVTEQKHLTSSINYLRGDVERLDNKISSIEQRPVKWWDRLIEVLISALVGAFIAWVVTKGA